MTPESAIFSILSFQGISVSVLNKCVPQMILFSLKYTLARGGIHSLARNSRDEETPWLTPSSPNGPAQLSTFRLVVILQKNRKFRYQFRTIGDSITNVLHGKIYFYRVVRFWPRQDHKNLGGWRKHLPRSVLGQIPIRKNGQRENGFFWLDKVRTQQCYLQFFFNNSTDY